MYIKWQVMFKRHINRLFRVSLIFVCWISVALAQSTEFKIITLKHRFANEIVSAIEPFMLAGESVSAIDNHILLKAFPDHIEEVEMLIETLDQPLKTYKISVSQQEDESLDTNDISAQAGVTIGNGRRKRGQVDVLLDDTKQSRKQNTEQFLRVMDGQFAFIQVGEIVAFTQQWIDLSQRYPQLQSLVSFRDVTTGFAVRPRSIGDAIELEIMPRMMRASGGGVIDFKEISTIVRVQPNTWVDIGGIMESQDELSRAILSKQQVSRKNKSILRVRVD